MKVGIVSLFGNFNYGNRLQNYALQEVLKRIGAKAEVIYIQSHKQVAIQIIRRLYYASHMYILRGATNRQINFFYKQRSIDAFNSSYICLKRYSDVSRIKGYDFYVLGSDQVWNPKRYDAVKKELFFLTFTQPEKKICFAPSFGVSELPEKWKDYFAEQLLTFPSISVRESAGAKIIKDLTGEDAEVLIDPTMMLSKEEWRAISQKPRLVDTDHSYVLTYFLGDKPQKAVSDASVIIKETGKKVLNLMDYENKALYTSGPSEFLYLIDHADLIQTDSFHACVFAFLFGKPFVLYAREGQDADMLSRIETLFRKFDLMRKFSGSGMDNDLFECDYTPGYEKLQEEQTRAINFLKKSMHIE